jgi:hypothetical protein
MGSELPYCIMGCLSCHAVINLQLNRNRICEYRVQSEVRLEG